MLDRFREGSQSTFAKVILAVLAVPFALWGVDAYVSNTGPATSVASVAGQDISAQEFDQALKNNLDQLRTQYGNTIDPALVDNPQFRQTVLDSLVNQRLLLRHVLSTGRTISDAQLAETISAMPAFHDNGRFSKVRYEGLLKQQGRTAAAFEAQLRQELLLQNYQQAVNETPVVANTTLDALIRASEQTREVTTINYTPEEFAGKVKIDDAAVKAYYDAHKPEFTVPDQAKVEYIVLSTEELAAQSQVADADIKKFYAEHAAQYRQEEQRQASHILINVAADANDAAKKAALTTAQDVAKQARADPKKFAALAEKHSQDPGSSIKGGDLGVISRGMMVKPFEDAVFDMKKDEIRGPVQSEFGYHIIRLTGITPAKTRSLVEATPDIIIELKKQGAAKKFAEAAEPFSNMVYEQSGSLKPAGETYGLTIKQSPWLTRRGSGIPELNNEKLLAAIFGDEVQKNKRNTEAVEVAPNKLVAARLLEFKAAALKPLAEVSEEIRTRLAREEGAKLAAKQGAEQLAQLQKGSPPPGLKWPAAKQVSRQAPDTLSPTALEAAFKASADALPAYVGAQTPEGGYSLIKVAKVTDGAPTDIAKKRIYADRLRSVAAQSEFAALLASLRGDVEVRVSKDLLEKKN